MCFKGTPEGRHRLRFPQIHRELIPKLGAATKKDESPARFLERGTNIKTKKTIAICTWNVRSLYQRGIFEILINQTETLQWDILGLSETQWIDSREFTFERHQIVCSGNNTIYRAGIALILKIDAQNALLGYNPISPEWLLLDSR